MVIGLLALTAIPTVTGMSLGISERSKPETAAKERARMRKFTLTCWCGGRPSRGKSAVHGGDVVLGEGKMWIQAASSRHRPSATRQDEHPLYPFSGFYLDYPDDQRPPPPPTGLVSMVSDSPPLMNWIYIDTRTWEVRHGNRTESRPHWVGNFGWTSEADDDFDTDPGGLVYESEERFVAVEPRPGSTGAAADRWEVFWDRNENRLAGVAAAQGRTVLRVSLERAYIEEELAEQAQKEPEAARAGTGPSQSSQAQATQEKAAHQTVEGNPPRSQGATQGGK